MFFGDVPPNETTLRQTVLIEMGLFLRRQTYYGPLWVSLQGGPLALFGGGPVLGVLGGPAPMLGVWSARGFFP